MKKVFALGFFEMKKICEKEGKSQTSPLYRVERENSLAVRLKPFTINDLDCPRVLTVEIRRTLEIWNQLLRLEEFSNLELTAAIWGTEASHDTRGNHTIMHTNCVITVREHLPIFDTCPANTKRNLLKRFAEKLKRRASADCLWPYVIPGLARLLPSETAKCSTSAAWRTQLLSFMLTNDEHKTRGNCCAVSWCGIKALWRGKERVRCGGWRPSQHGHKNCNQFPDHPYPGLHWLHSFQTARS